MVGVASHCREMKPRKCRRKWVCPSGGRDCTLAVGPTRPGKSYVVHMHMTCAGLEALAVKLHNSTELRADALHLKGRVLKEMGG